MKNVYDKINDLEISYEEESLKELEKQRLINTSKKYSKEKSKLPKFIGLAAAFGLILSLSLPSVRANAINLAKNISISMMETIGAGGDSEKYVTKLHQEIPFGDDSFIIENIVFEDNKVFIDRIADSSFMEDVNKFPSIYKIVIDDKTYLSEGESGSYHTIDQEGKIGLSTSMIDFAEDFPQLENANVDIYLSAFPKVKVISIKSDVNVVNEANKILAEDFTIPNSDGIKIDKMKINPVSLSAVISNITPGYSYDLYGQDENGNRLQLDLRVVKDNKANFIYNSYMSDLSLDDIKDAKEITFKLMAAKMNEESGKETSEDYEQVGDDFILSVQ